MRQSDHVTEYQREGTSKAATQTWPWTAVAPDEGVTVLIISPDEQDHELLHSALPAGWRILAVRGYGEGTAALRGNSVAVVVAERDLDQRSWLDVLAEIRASSRWPAPRLVVASRLADERLWAEVLNRGAYDLLLKPFHPAEVSWVVGQAWLEWKREKEAGPAARASGLRTAARAF